MTNVSKKKLEPRTQDQLFKQFTLLFSSADSSSTSKMFDSLFTESEKIMFVKRVAIVLLIAEEYSTYAIAKTLNVSDKTVRDILKQAKAGRYDSIIAVTRKKSFDKKRFWETVEVLLRGGLPPMGKNRWKWLDKHFD